MKRLIKIELVVLVLFFLILNVSVIYADQIKKDKLHNETTPYYLALKYIYAFGDNYEDVTGDKGYGIGIDLGYRLYHHLSIEIDFTYENSNVIDAEENSREDIKYYTTSLDLVYAYEVFHRTSIIFKTGFEIEYEKEKKSTKKSEGIIFAVGVEYDINSRYKFISEYEKSTVNGPKGDVIMMGIVYNF